MLRAIIVDDEPNARKALGGLLNENFAGRLEIVAECGNVPEAVKAIRKLRPSIVFLDVDMPGYSGFELIDFFEEEELTFRIIFVTAHSEYALRAFEISAVDYLLKPVQLEPLSRAIKKLSAADHRLQPNYEVLQAALKNSSDKKIVLHTAENIFVIKLDDILYIEAEGNYSRFITASQGNLLISKKLNEFEYLEQMGSFMRCHRSYIINLNKIKKVNKKEHTLLMNNGAEVMLAQDKKQGLLDRLSS